MIDATHAKAHRTASSLAVQKMGGGGRLIGRTKGGLKLENSMSWPTAKGRPIRMFLSAGQTSDYMGARALLPSIPKVAILLGTGLRTPTGSATP